jgi:hypothetical protein
MIGDGIVHLRQIGLGNHAEYNAGAVVLVADLAFPVLLLAILALSSRKAANK